MSYGTAICKKWENNCQPKFVTYTDVYAGHLQSIYIFNIRMRQYISGENQQVCSPHT